MESFGSSEFLSMVFSVERSQWSVDFIDVTKVFFKSRARYSCFLFYGSINVTNRARCAVNKTAAFVITSRLLLHLRF